MFRRSLEGDRMTVQEATDLVEKAESSDDSLVEETGRDIRKGFKRSARGGEPVTVHERRLKGLKDIFKKKDD